MPVRVDASAASELHWHFASANNGKIRFPASNKQRKARKRMEIGSRRQFFRQNENRLKKTRRSRNSRISQPFSPGAVLQNNRAARKTQKSRAGRKNYAATFCCRTILRGCKLKNIKLMRFLTTCINTLCILH